MKWCPFIPQDWMEKSGLPLKHNIVHSIELQPGVGPVSVRPYRYPHLHKYEIEKQVQGLLDQGIIDIVLVPSLVWTQSWRMCVDYCELNKVTVPNKYHIPVVEELLDELHGATYFSKIDLKRHMRDITNFSSCPSDWPMHRQPFNQPWIKFLNLIS